MRAKTGQTCQTGQTVPTSPSVSTITNNYPLAWQKFIPATLQLEFICTHRRKCVHYNPVQGSTGASQGNPCNENRIPAMRTGFPVMKTGVSLWEFPHRDFITGNGFAVSQILMALPIKVSITYPLGLSFIHCKPKPCKAYRELPVSQFSLGKTCFHYREPCSHCRDPVFITRISLQNPVLPYMGLQCILCWF